jgi:AraC-like DNA-binding protein
MARAEVAGDTPPAPLGGHLDGSEGGADPMKTAQSTLGRFSMPAPRSSPVGPAWRKPVLDDLLGRIRFRQGEYCRPEWMPTGMSLERKCPVFHIVEHGTCWLEVKGQADPVKLSEGDLAVVTRGGAHRISSHTSTPAAGSSTSFVCGEAQFDPAISGSLIAMLPPVLHVKRTEKRWLGLTTQQIVAEMESGDAGAAEVITRLTEILFIRAVRAYFDRNMETSDLGWVAALRDEQIGRALAMLHQNLQENWTVDSLSRGVALSRSAFAARFRESLGEPPLHYLTRLRINSAAIRLRSSDCKLKAVAAAVGYKSVAAFVKAFRRRMGRTPGDYRRTPLEGSQSDQPPSWEAKTVWTI